MLDFDDLVERFRQWQRARFAMVKTLDFNGRSEFITRANAEAAIREAEQLVADFARWNQTFAADVSKMSKIAEQIYLQSDDGGLVSDDQPPTG